MRFLPALAALAACLCLTGCLTLTWTPLKKPDDTLALKAASFAQLPGWNDDRMAEALAPLEKSCARIRKKDPAADFGAGGIGGKAANWQEVCHKLYVLLLPTNDEAREFFERNFTPYEIHGAKGREGLFTGYYEPTLHGSRRKHGKYKIPLYGRPDDLVKVSLGDFRPELKGETLMGRVSTEKKLIPYYKRAEIEKGALKKQRREIVWVDSAVDAFFLHIQGSGRVVLDNGKILRIGYAAENGQPYVTIGREMIKSGALEKDNVSMQSIRDWLESHPDEAAEVMNLNTSYIFFQKLKGEDGPLGAEGLPLTPRRSLAVDRKKIPYGAPVWLDTKEPFLQRMMIAQDTGGAITGAVRGDFFWGAGDDAAENAGRMKSPGQSWILLPKTVTVPKEKLRNPLPLGFLF